MVIPKFIIKNNMQKSTKTGLYFRDLISDNDLEQISRNLTGSSQYTVEFVNNDYKDDFLDESYNKGRLGILHFKSKVYYICFSDFSNAGRNSAVQSVPTAYNMFYLNKFVDKELVFYFLPSSGNNATNYHKFMYRLMATAGFKFLNTPSELIDKLQPFNSIDDIILARKENSNRNSSNNATYILKNNNHNYDIYGKTYGANKYETSLICYAVSSLATRNDKITLYQYNEKDLKELPKSSLLVLKKMGNLRIINIDDELEKQELRKTNSIRSPRFNARLLDRFGDKKCVLCGCEINEIIQGAHIWPVSEIKKRKDLSITEQLEFATDGENGLWMCQNHHKLFDSHIIRLTENGQLKYMDQIPEAYKSYINSVTTIFCLPPKIVTRDFRHYIRLRNGLLQD
ncbi:TPA: HNH endonuclease [Streptococcus suis]